MMEAQTFSIGDRVRAKRIWVRGKGEHGGWTGTVVALPGTHSGPQHLYAVQVDGETDDDNKYCAIAADLLELLCA